MEARVRRGAQPLPQARIGRQRRQRPRRRVDVAERHQNALLAVAHDLPAARNVGGHNRPAGGGGFDQRARQTLAIGQQHRDVMFAPDLRHIGVVAVPSDSRLASTIAPAWLAVWSAGLAGSGSPNRCSSTGAPAARARRTASTASTIPLGRIMRATTATFNGGAGGASLARKFFRVDARSADDGDVGAVRVKTELARIVAVLEQIMGPRAAQP